MSVEHTEAAEVAVDFVVRPDGTVAGDDGALGGLAAALPYTGRLARRMGELVDAGDLRALEAYGVHRLSVGVTWTPAGEGTYRATLRRLEARVVPTYMVVGAVDTSAAVAHCIDRIMTIEGVRWSSVVTASSRVIAAAGDRRELQHLAEVGNRMLAILRSLEDQHATGFMRLHFEGGAVVGASLGRHAIVTYAGATSDDELLAVIDEVRAILADHDLSTVPTEFDPDAVDPDLAGEGLQDDGVQVIEPPPQAPPPLAGARFAGAGQREPRRSRRRFGR